MTDKKSNAAGNQNKTGGSYKEKQPAAKPSKHNEEVPVDEDGDGKSESVAPAKQPKTKTSTGK